NLLGDSARSSAKQARQNLRIAPTYLPGRPDKLLANYRTSGGFETVLVSRGRTYSSSFLSLRQVPGGLRALVKKGQLGYQRETVAGTHFLVVGGPSKGAQLYYFFSEEGLRHELAVLRNILLIGGGLLVLLAALAGAVLAREALRPVAQASNAAHSLAEGLLETRLPVEGQDEFGAWAQAFNEMAAALETKIEALSAAQARERRFTADVAHELRTPLTGLVGAASLLAEHLVQRPPESPPADHGPGIAPEHLPHLFERFYKADPSRSGRGSGLGLAIAQENARLLGGEIGVESDPRRGSRFTLRL